jgi:hypothetical protein
VERTIAEELAKHKFMDQKQDHSDEDSVRDLEIDRFKSHDFHFSNRFKSAEDDYIDYLLSTGLDFLYDLMKADTQDSSEQEHTIVRSHGRVPVSLRTFARFHALNYNYNCKWNKQMFERDMAPQDQDCDYLNQCNEAYPWSFNYHPPQRYVFGDS